jgi:hypothetical protein
MALKLFISKTSFFPSSYNVKGETNFLQRISTATINYLHKRGLLFRIKTRLAFKLGHVFEVSV